MDRDLYVVLGVPRDASSEILRDAYKRLAATTRPPELSPATLRRGRLGQPARRQTDSVSDLRRRQQWLLLQSAFDTLMNPRRRSLYDRGCAARSSSCDPIVVDNVGTAKAPNNFLSRVPAELNVDSSDAWVEVNVLFQELLAAENAAVGFCDANRNAAGFGNMDSPWDDVREFYSFWTAWKSSRSFTEAEKHSSMEIAAAPNRAVRRCMEQENEKCRKTLSNQFHIELRDALEALRGRDPRVAAHQLQVLRDETTRKEVRLHEEERRQEDRRERRRLARKLEQERWATEVTEVASASLVPDHSHPTPEVAWVCSLCDTKGFRTKQAFDDHLTTKRHKRNARRVAEASPQGKIPSALYNCQHDHISSNEGSGVELLALGLPLAAADGQDQRDITIPPFEFRTESGSIYSVVCAFGVEHWFRIFCCLEIPKIVVAACSFLCAGIFREGSMGDDSLWRMLTSQFWTKSEQTDMNSLLLRGYRQAWRGFIRLASATSNCLKLCRGAGVPCCPGEGLELWSFMSERRRADPPYKAVTFESPLRAIAVGNGLIAASTFDSSEVRLFVSSSLSRLPPLPRRRRGNVSLLSLPSRGDIGMLAVAEDSGLVRLENVSGTLESPADSEPVLLWGAAPKDGVCCGLSWLQNSNALCCAWRTGAALFDAARPGNPVASCSCPEGNLNSLFSMDNGCAVLLGKHGALRLWDFRATPRQGFERESLGMCVNVTCSAASRVDLSVVVGLATDMGPSICHIDLRAGGREHTINVADIVCSRDFSSTEDIRPNLYASHVALGAANDVYAVLSDRVCGRGCIFTSFVGGNALHPLGAWRCLGVDITALHIDSSGCGEDLLGVARQRHSKMQTVAELRLLCEKSTMSVAHAGDRCESGRKLKPKAKKVFRKHETGDGEFRSLAGRRNFAGGSHCR